ncbi:MAG: hypothetical protein ACLRR6_10210 [Oscillospiraceae bacterium]
MEAIRSYLTAVVAVSMIAVLASALAHGSRMERVVRFAAGLLALLVCVTPLLRLDARTLTDVLEQAERALDYDASKTDRTRQDMLRDLIRENTERTIEKQAEALGMLVRADVTLTEEEYPQPWSATLTGTLDPERGPGAVRNFCRNRSASRPNGRRGRPMGEQEEWLWGRSIRKSSGRG